MRVLFLVLALILALLLSTQARQAHAEDFRVVTTVEQGIPCIQNPAHPRDGIHHATLRELWRVGGEEDDVFFGLVAKVCTDEQGRVYVLDSQTCQVYMYSPTGKLLRVLFREGEGPGEIRQARDMVVLDDGRVGVIQELPGAVSFVHPDGTPAGRAQLFGPEGGATNLTCCQATGQVLLVSGTYARQGDQPNLMAREMTLERYAPSGEFVCRYVSSLGTYDFEDFRFRELEHLPPFWFSFLADTDGRVHTVTDSREYAIRVFAPDGRLEKIITRKHTPLNRSPREIRRLELMILSAFGASPFKPTVEIAPQVPALSYFHRPLQRHADGTLWTLPGRGVHPDQEGVMAVFDVFDQEGIFIRQEALHAPHHGYEVGIFLAGEDRVLVVKGYLDSLAAQFGNGTALADEEHEPQAPEVVCYALDRK